MEKPSHIGNFQAVEQFKCFVYNRRKKTFAFNTHAVHVCSASQADWAWHATHANQLMLYLFCAWFLSQQSNQEQKIFVRCLYKGVRSLYSAAVAAKWNNKQISWIINFFLGCLFWHLVNEFIKMNLDDEISIERQSNSKSIRKYCL